MPRDAYARKHDSRADRKQRTRLRKGYGEARVCLTCPTVLNRYNDDTLCAACRYRDDRRKHQALDQLLGACRPNDQRTLTRVFPRPDRLMKDQPL